MDGRHFPSHSIKGSNWCPLCVPACVGSTLPRLEAENGERCCLLYYYYITSWHHRTVRTYQWSFASRRDEVEKGPSSSQKTLF